MQVYAGGDLGNDGHQMAILNTGAVVSWGSNLCDQLGAGRPKQESVPVPVKVLSGLTVSDVVAGGSTSYIIDSTGKVWAWGSNKGGQVRQPASHVSPLPPSWTLAPRCCQRPPQTLRLSRLTTPHRDAELVLACRWDEDGRGPPAHMDRWLCPTGVKVDRCDGAVCSRYPCGAVTGSESQDHCAT